MACYAVFNRLPNKMNCLLSEGANLRGLLWQCLRNEGEDDDKVDILRQKQAAYSTTLYDMSCVPNSCMKIEVTIAKGKIFILPLKRFAFLMPAIVKVQSHHRRTSRIIF